MTISREVGEPECKRGRVKESCRKLQGKRMEPLWANLVSCKLVCSCVIFWWKLAHYCCTVNWLWLVEESDILVNFRFCQVFLMTRQVLQSSVLICQLLIWTHCDLALCLLTFLEANLQCFIWRFFFWENSGTSLWKWGRGSYRVSEHTIPLWHCNDAEPMQCGLQDLRRTRLK